MKFIRKLILFISIFSPVQIIHGQILKDSLDKVYTLDPFLYNGKKYTYYLPGNTKGSQYLVDGNFLKGNILINGIVYDDLKLNYDIYNQQLLLKYKNLHDAIEIVIVSDAWLENFTMEDKTFEYSNLNNKSRQIYQVIGEDKIRVYYYWEKNVKLDNTSGNPMYKFSKPVKETYLFINSQLKKYRNNRSFISSLDPAKQEYIKKYIQEHKINVKNAPDKIMLDLVTTCNSI